MSTEKTQAIVIRLADFSESSKVVTLFTRDFGKVSAIAKGAKRLRSAFEAALDLLTVCNIVFIRKASGGLDILTEAQLVQRFKAQQHGLEKLYAGYYVAELLSALTEDYDPHPELYDEAVRTLNRLSGDGAWDLPIFHFELVLLREIGQLPVFENCVVCGTPASPEGWFDFRVSYGGLVCAACQTEESNPRRIQGGTLAVVRRMLSENETAWTRVAVSSQQKKELRSVLTAVVSQALGRRPKMLNFLKFTS